MKTFVAFLLIAVAATLAVNIHQEWEQFKVKYNRHYDAREDAFRFEIFAQNKHLIDVHNARYQKGEVSFKMAVNQFTDWTQEEIEKLNGFRPPTGQIFKV